MADYRVLVPIIKKWEGGFSDNPNDSGGATNKGVTLATFRQFYGQNKTVNDLKAITDAQWLNIFLSGYWNKVRATEINNQSIANIIVDWAWASGPDTAARKVQKIVCVDVDGIVGPKTLASINAYNPQQLFDKIKAERISFVENLVKQRPKDSVFLTGWKNRINSFFFEAGGKVSNIIQEQGLLIGAACLLIFLVFGKWNKRKKY